MFSKKKKIPAAPAPARVASEEERLSAALGDARSQTIQALQVFENTAAALDAAAALFSDTAEAAFEKAHNMRQLGDHARDSAASADRQAAAIRGIFEGDK